MHELAKSGLFNDSPLAKIDYSTTQSYPYLVHVARGGNSDMTSMSPERAHVLNEHGINTEGSYVLYWMIATRRLHYNPSLQYAVEMAQKLGKTTIGFGAVSQRVMSMPVIESLRS